MHNHRELGGALLRPRLDKQCVVQAWKLRKAWHEGCEDPCITECPRLRFALPDSLQACIVSSGVNNNRNTTSNHYRCMQRCSSRFCPAMAMTPRILDHLAGVVLLASY